MIYAAAILALIVIIQYFYIRRLIKEINRRDEGIDYFGQKEYLNRFVYIDDEEAEKGEEKRCTRKRKKRKREKRIC